MSVDNSQSPSMPEAIKTFVLSLFADLFHTALPGVIESYDSTTRKAKVTPQLKRKYLDGSELIYQPIEDVPVMFFGAGSSGFRLPENELVGQTCLLIFCERSLDFWKSQGELTVPGNTRKYSISDGVALVGLNSFNNTDDGGDDLTVFRGNSKITIKKDETILAENQNGKFELKPDGQFNINDGNLTVDYE